MIQSNSNLSFGAKIRFLPRDTYYNAQKLARWMRAAEKRTQKSTDTFEYSAIRGLEIENKAFFKDGQFLAKRNENNELVPYGKNTYMIETKKFRLIFNNRAGEIIEYKKPFFKTWKSIFRETDLAILGGLNHFYNDKFVKKIMIKKTCLTQEGQRKMAKVADELLDFVDKMGKIWG